MDKYKINSNNITFHYLGCTKKYDSLVKQSNDNVFKIVSCSAIISLKRIDLILEALKDWSICKIKWTHIGTGDLFDSIKEKAIRISKDNKLVEIDLKGYMENDKIQKYYAKNNIDLFINISLMEGIPVSIMECMAYSIPVIATNVGGNCEIVDENTGILVDVNLSAEKLKYEIEQFYKKSTWEKNKYKERSYEKWNEKFNAEKNIKAHFREVLL